MEGKFSELRYKEVISVTDGTRYGFVGDLRVELDSGRILALVIPGQARFFGLFGRKEDTIIRWEDVRRFGEDIILVEGVPEYSVSSRGRRRWF